MPHPFCYAALLSLGLLACSTSAPRGPQPITSAPRADTGAAPVEVSVFQNGEGGYVCYRIPAIVRAPSGALLAFAEGRVAHCGDFGDVDIVLRTSLDNGRTWSSLRRAADSVAMSVSGRSGEIGAVLVA